ncbi:hypothetical protein [Marinovum sp.]|uniref:hypothetical protein n=1 Tax=Marinovum sp. TaxID=2024839 RepID=UPI002B26BA68|nr:hypothetical protein [Marinovum sp.]
MSRPRAATVLRLLVLIALLVLANRYLQAFFAMLEADLAAADPRMLRRLVVSALLLYALALALPFVPGIEIGLMLMAIGGPEMGYLVYLCTLVGLWLAFIAGRLVPPTVLARLAGEFGLRRAQALFLRLGALPQEAVFPALVAAAPNRAAAVLLRQRYLALALLFNMPGNIVLGGGGGIAMMAGLSRVFSPLLFALTTMLAVAPVPLTIAFLGD